MELRMMLRLPPRPWAPPKYYFLQKQYTSLKSQGSLSMFTLVFLVQSQAAIPLWMIIQVSSIDIGAKFVLNSSSAWSQDFCSSKTAYRKPGTPQSNYHWVLSRFYLSWLKHLQILYSFYLKRARFLLMKPRCMPQSHTLTSDIRKEKDEAFLFFFRMQSLRSSYCYSATLIQKQGSLSLQMSSSPTMCDFDENISLSFQDCFLKKANNLRYMQRYPDGPAQTDMSYIDFLGLDDKVVMVGILTSLKNFQRRRMRREQIWLWSGLTILNILRKGFSMYLISSISNLLLILRSMDGWLISKTFLVLQSDQQFAFCHQMQGSQTIIMIRQQLKNRQQMLQFCQECEVYHNTKQQNGEQVITQCEKKVNELQLCETSQPSADIIYFNRHDFSPISKASFTSINNHPTLQLQPASQSYRPSPSVKIKFSSPSTPQFKPNIRIIPPQIQNPSPLNRPNFNINIIPSDNPSLASVQQKKLQWRKNNKENNVFLNLKAKKLLTTIKEEKSESSPSKTSLLSSQTKIKQQMKSTYEFKDLRKNRSVNEFGAQTPNQNDNNWCCW